MILPMIVDRIIKPALSDMPGPYNTHEARVMLIAIGLQESEFKARKQIGGPARGLWQFERGGGVAGVLNHSASKDAAKHLCATHSVRAHPDDVYKELELNDWLACGFARLLLRTDPAPLPTTESGAWTYYLRLWRPGKPHASTWPQNYALAKAYA